MTRTYSIKPILEALEHDSQSGDQNELVYFISFNADREKESSIGPQKRKRNDDLIKYLIDYFESDDRFSSSDNSDKQQTTEHNVERFRIHSHSNLEMSSAIPKSIYIPSFAEERELLLAKIRSCYFEAGILCDADTFFSKLVRQHRSIEYPLSLLSDITNHNIDNEHVLEGVLHILSNCDYSAINPFGISIVLAASVNHSPVIQELLISCFESWDAADGIDILEKLELDIPWLDQYRNEVVSQLKENVVSA